MTRLLMRYFIQDSLHRVSSTSKAESETDAIKHKYNTCETLTL